MFHLPQKKSKIIADKVADVYEKKQEIKAEIMQCFVPYTSVLNEATRHTVSSHLSKNAIPKLRCIFTALKVSIQQQL